MAVYAILDVVVWSRLKGVKVDGVSMKWFVTLVMVLLAGSEAVLAGVVDTKHNLSVSGTGSIKATSEQEICIFCHVSHFGYPPEQLWNHTFSGEAYTTYSSDTLFTTMPGQPFGLSTRCLSCHDGTVPLGSIQQLPGLEGPGIIEGLEKTLAEEGSGFVLGTDLTNDHPVSIIYDTGNSELASMATLDANGLALDENDQVQCGSCHDPHSDANPKFLRKPVTDEQGYGAVLCRSCHDKQYWSTVPNMPHRESENEWNGSGVNPWHVLGHDLANDPDSTPKKNSCANCHQPHGAVKNQLVKNDGGNSGISQVCLTCHNLNVASGKNIQASMDKEFAHPVQDPNYVERHAPERMTDGKVREQAANLGSNRHAQCPDCHNPHAVSAGVSPNINDTGGTNNLASNVLKGVWGVVPSWPGNWGQVTDFTEVDDVQYQYQLCLKCHSYYAFGSNPPLDPWRLMSGDGKLTDQAIEFNPNNASYHPVAAAGKNDFIMDTASGILDYSGSLVGNLRPDSTMTCADCHSDDEYTGLAGSTVPKGPHGSNKWPMLEAQWDTTTGTSGTEDHLCFKCHDNTVYGYGSNSTAATSPQSGFSAYTGMFSPINLHYVHGTLFPQSCSTCHSAVPHGWKRRAMLVYGRTDPDPAPYNRNGVDSGLDSRIDFGGPEKSGNWECCQCHQYFEVGFGCGSQMNGSGFVLPNSSSGSQESKSGGSSLNPVYLLLLLLAWLLKKPLIKLIMPFLTTQSLLFL